MAARIMCSFTRFCGWTASYGAGQTIGSSWQAKATPWTRVRQENRSRKSGDFWPIGRSACARCTWRSEEHTSELQSHSDLVCRLLLEKKKTEKKNTKSSA